MSSEPKLTIAGDNDLASDAARHAISSGLADPVYLWRTIDDPIVGAAAVVILADVPERAGFARSALNAGLPVVSLPIDQPDEQIAQAVFDGGLRFLSSLHGLPTMARLASDCSAGLYGRRYGVFAAHRLPRNAADLVPACLCDLVVYVCSLVESPMVRLSATASTLGGKTTAAWFLLVRFADDTIATIEVGALLPDADESTGELLVEVTGSEAVLRAEPERQAVITVGSDGLQRQSWYAEPSEWILTHAVKLLESSSAPQQRSLSNIWTLLHEAARSIEAVEVR